jgi:tRNA threonylcarbamoyladenosine biosynthesis protein TsaE
MIFATESDLASFATSLSRLFLESQNLPICLELIGDVGAGKTTFTRALAEGLGIATPVTSPSFTISKHYTFTLNPNERSAETSCESSSGATSVTKNAQKLGELIHYDFYRLDDPGLMAEDLAESLTQPNTIVVLEWADSIKDLLPENHFMINFTVLEDGSRSLTFNQPLKKLLEQGEEK